MLTDNLNFNQELNRKKIEDIYGSTSVEDKFLVYIRDELFTSEYKIYGLDEIEDSAKIQSLLLFNQTKKSDRLEDFLNDQLLFDLEFQNILIIISPKKKIYKTKSFTQFKELLDIEHFKSKAETKDELKELMVAKEKMLLKSLTRMKWEYINWGQEWNKIKLNRRQIELNKLPAALKPDKSLLKEYILKEINEEQRLSTEEIILAMKRDRKNPFIYSEELFREALTELRNNKRLFAAEEVVYKDFLTYLEDITNNFAEEKMKERLRTYIKTKLLGFGGAVYSPKNVKDSAEFKLVLLLDKFANQRELRTYLEDELYRDLVYQNTILVIEPKEDISNTKYLKKLNEVLKAEELIDELEGRDNELLEMLEEEESLQQDLSEALGNYLVWSKKGEELELEKREFGPQNFRLNSLDPHKQKIKDYILNQLDQGRIRAKELFERSKKDRAAPLLIREDKFYEQIKELINKKEIFSFNGGDNLYLSSYQNIKLEKIDLFAKRKQQAKKETKQKRAETTARRNANNELTKKIKDNRVSNTTKEEKMMKVFDVVGFDNGYDYVKLVLGPNKEERVLFPSVTYTPEETFSIFNMNNLSSSAKFSKEKMNITFNGEKYYIGDYAVEQHARGGEKNFSDEKFKDESELAKLLAGISLFTSEDKIMINNLVLGLNVEKYQKYKEELINRFKNKTFAYKLSNSQNSNELTVKNVICVPQGMGAYYDQILDMNGRPARNELANARFALIDIGGKTVDGFISQGTDPIIGTDIGTDFGMADAFREVAKKLGVDIPYNLISRNYIKGRDEVFWRGKSRKFVEYIDGEFEEFATDIYELINEQWGHQLARIRRLLLCGGGAKFLGEYLLNKFAVEVKLLENAQFSNTSGYYKLGVYSLSREREVK